METVNGRECCDGWGAKLRDAQRYKWLIMEKGAPVKRLRWGEEGWDADHPCHDCAAKEGQLHVYGCDVERCPACGHQLISCDCHTGAAKTKSWTKRIKG